MLEDKSLKLEETLAHAVSAMYALQNHNSCAPIQFVTSVLSDLSSVFVDSHNTKHHLEKMYSVRRAFVKTEFEHTKQHVQTVNDCITSERLTTSKETRVK